MAETFSRRPEEYFEKGNGGSSFGLAISELAKTKACRMLYRGIAFYEGVKEVVACGIECVCLTIGRGGKGIRDTRAIVNLM